MMPTKLKPVLKYDPTRTTSFRNKFARQLKKQFAQLKSRVRQYVALQNAFGLTTNATLQEAVDRVHPTPSRAQWEAGNYRKGHVVIQGLPITIETAAGKRRQPQYPPLKHHYGYIKRTTGKDGDHVDVFIGPYPESEAVFVVDQGDPFDEHKVMLGFLNSKDAAKAYSANYGGRKPGPVTALTVEQFKHWLQVGDTAKPISDQTIIANSLTINKEYAFATDPDKLEAFQGWIAQQLDTLVRGRTQEQLWDVYIQQGYAKGAGRAINDNKEASWQPEEYQLGEEAGVLKTVLGAPANKESVKLLASRTFDEMENVTDDMANRMSRALADGMVEGKSPYEVADDIDEAVDLGYSRAVTVARTELIRAHAEGQLASFEAMGVDELGVMVEFTVSDDSRICDECAGLANELYSIEDAANVIPVHVNCRCCWVPYVGDLTTNAGCGSGEKGSPGFQPGNDCGKGGAALGERKAEKGEVALLGRLPKLLAFHAGSEHAILYTKKWSLEVNDAFVSKIAQLKRAVQFAHPVTEKDLAENGKPTVLARELSQLVAAGYKHVRDDKGALIGMLPPKRSMTVNAFCPTGPGGGIDPSCGHAPNPSNVTYIKTLPGSTAPQLVKDANGKLWKMKQGNADLLNNEHDADNVYKALGVDVPESHIVEHDGKTYKFNEYLEGAQTLKEWEHDAPPGAAELMHQAVSLDFVADALLANWDVVGLQKDNIMVKDGKPYRVDNGGALKYRAQGTPKGSTFGSTVGELSTLRNANVNYSAASVFKGVTADGIKAGIKDVLSKKAEVLAAIKDPTTKTIVEKRIEYLAQYKNNPVSAPAPASTSTVPLHTGAGLAKYIGKNAGGLKYTQLQLDKIAHMNPDGVQSGAIKVPKALKQEHIDQLKKVLPPGTQIESVLATSKMIGLKVGASVAGTSQQKFGTQGSTSVPSHGTADHEPEFKAAVQVLKAHADEALSKLSKDQIHNIKDYTGSGYASLNSKMRECPPKFECVEGGLKHTMDSIVSAIESAPPLPKPILVNRGIHASSNSKAKELLTSLQEAKDAGETFSMPSVTSASVKGGFGGSGSNGFKFRILAKTGLFVRDISHFPHEYEVLKSPNNKYKVTDIKQHKDGSHEVFMEEQ
jgi:SPP1 gp7 family putative phage head morphogenesis protein